MVMVEEMVVSVQLGNHGQKLCSTLKLIDRLGRMELPPPTCVVTNTYLNL